MVNTADFYKHTEIICDRSHPLGKRIMSLLDEVVERLPDEEQFKIKCRLIIFPFYSIEINLIIFLFNFSYKVNYFRDKFVGIKYRIAMALTFSKEQLIWHAKLV